MSSCQRCSMTNSSMATTVCGHKFCTSCLVTFVLNHKSNRCPKCDMVVVTDSHPVQPMRRVMINPPRSTFPIASGLSGPSVAKAASKPVVKKSKPVPRPPTETASELEKKLYERKIVMGNFNDRKITFIKPDGTDFLLSEYHKVVADFKVNPKALVQCDEFSFEKPDTEEGPVPPTVVFIPKFKEITPVTIA